MAKSSRRDRKRNASSSGISSSTNDSNEPKSKHQPPAPAEFNVGQSTSREVTALAKREALPNHECEPPDNETEPKADTIKSGSVQVKQEQGYGCETDEDEESNQLAAPAKPSPVLSSAAYGQDTDDEESEPLDNETEPKPDTIESVQVKQEQGYECETDEEDSSHKMAVPAKPSPVLLSLATADKAFEQDTDDEGSNGGDMKTPESAGEVNMGGQNGETVNNDNPPPSHLLGVKFDKVEAESLATPIASSESEQNKRAEDENTLENRPRRRSGRLAKSKEQANEKPSFEKLNLYEGEGRDIYPGEGFGRYEWNDMKPHRDGDKVLDFVWCRNKTDFWCLPKDTYTFWSTLGECKTWGDIREKYTDGFYQVLKRRREGSYNFSKTTETIEDEEEFDPDSLCDFDSDACGLFPPFIEFIQAASLGFFCRYAFEPHGKWGEESVRFLRSEQDTILAAIEAYGGRCHFEPGLFAGAEERARRTAGSSLHSMHHGF